MAKYKLTINDTDRVLINTIPAQLEDGFEEGIKVQLFINNKYQGEYIIKHLGRRDNF